MTFSELASKVRSLEERVEMLERKIARLQPFADVRPYTPPQYDPNIEPYRLLNIVANADRDM